MPKTLNIYQINFVYNEPRVRNKVILGTEQGFLIFRLLKNYFTVYILSTTIFIDFSSPESQTKCLKLMLLNFFKLVKRCQQTILKTLNRT